MSGDLFGGAPVVPIAADGPAPAGEALPELADLPRPAMPELLRAVAREIRMRQVVYPVRMARLQMKRAEAVRELACMVEVYRLLRDGLAPVGITETENNVTCSIPAKP